MMTFSKDDLNSCINEFLALNHSTILVCGCLGLIASTFIEIVLTADRRLDLDIRIIAAGRGLERIKERYHEYGGMKQLSYCNSDITTMDGSMFENRSFDYVINAVSPAHPIAYAKHPVEVMNSNYLGTLNLLKLCSENKARLLYISSGEVYGEKSSGHGKFSVNKEDDYGYIDVLKVRSCYPEAKRATETLCIAYNDEYGTDSVIARPCQIYGPSISTDNTRADAQFLRKCILGEDIVMKSTGSQKRSMCYVKDAVSALLSILVYGKKSNAYNIANRESEATIREYAELMANMAGVRIVNDFPSDMEQKGFSTVQNAVIDPKRLEELGWRARYSLCKGIEDTLQQCGCRRAAADCQ